MRELVKSFRAKLHKLATAINESPLDENLYKEIETFLSEKPNGQNYPLSNADVIAMQKLEAYVSEGFEQTQTQTETENITNIKGPETIQPYDYLQGDNISLVNATDFSRELQSQNPTDRETQEKAEPETFLEVSRLDKSLSQEAREEKSYHSLEEKEQKSLPISQEIRDEKSLPKSSYPIVNDAKSEVFDEIESEMGLTNRKENEIPLIELENENPLFENEHPLSEKEENKYLSISYCFVDYI